MISYKFFCCGSEWVPGKGKLTRCETKFLGVFLSIKMKNFLRNKKNSLYNIYDKATWNIQLLIELTSEIKSDLFSFKYLMNANMRICLINHRFSLFYLFFGNLYFTHYSFQNDNKLFLLNLLLFLNLFFYLTYNEIMLYQLNF